MTVEVICHGVPSQKMFKDYLNTLGGSIKEFRFRNKEKGWGYTASVTGNSGRVRYIHRKSSSYYDGFIKGYFLRKSCYACAFASKTRCADITVGDFWGVFKDYKRVLIRNVSKWENGISACIINTDVGHDLFEAASNKINKFKVSFEQISVANYRLLHGDPIPQKRESLMSQYKKWGYNSIEDDFHKHRECGIKVKIKELLPSRIKFLLKCIK